VGVVVAVLVKVVEEDVEEEPAMTFLAAQTLAFVWGLLSVSFM
jgi:hypothetical protein